MLVSDIARRVRGYAGDDTGAMVSTEFIIDGTNDAMLEINIITNAMIDFGSLSPGAGDAYIEMGDDFITFLRIFGSIANGNKDANLLIPISRNQASTLFGTQSTHAQGTPKYYASEHKHVWFYPIPDAEYFYEYEAVKVPEQVTALGDSLVYPAYLQPLVARWVFALVKERDEDFEAALAVKGEVRVKSAELMATMKNAQEETYPYIVDTEGGYSSFPVGSG